MKSGSYPERYQQFWTQFAKEVRRPDSGLSDLVLRVENSKGARCYVSKFGMEQKLEAWWCILKQAMRVQIVLMDSGAERLFERLKRDKDQIESDYGEQLVWVDPRENPKKAKQEGKTYFVQCEDISCETSNPASWPAQQRTLMKLLRRFYDVFAIPERLPDLMVDRS